MAALPAPQPAPSPADRPQNASPPGPAERWHNWVRHPDGAAVFYGDLDGIEIPLDRVDTPGAVLATLVHHGLDKPWPDPRADLGALVAAIHDLRDLWRVYCRGMQLEAWDSYGNRALKWLWQQVELLPPHPRRSDYAHLGDKLLDIANLLDLRAVFGA